MKNEIKIRYTNEAESRLELLTGEYKIRLEELIKEKKYVPGDKLIEITGSDIEAAAKYIEIKSPRKTRFRENIIGFYLIFGIALTVIGLFYNFLINIVRENPLQLMLILLGASMILGAFILSRSTKNREIPK